MWIKEHEFARVKLADQKYKSKRKFSFLLLENFSMKFSGKKFSTKFWSKLFGYIDVGDKWMLLTLSWWQFLDVGARRQCLKIEDVGNEIGQNGHQHLKVVTNTIRLQHPSSKSMSAKFSIFFISIIEILIKIFCGQKLKTIKITRNISAKWFWNWEEESWRRKCYWRRKTNSDWRRNKRIWRSSSSYQIKVFSDLGHVTHVTRF